MRALWMAACVIVTLVGAAPARPTAPARPVAPARPEYKWCMIELPDYVRVCVFRSIEECRVELPGIGIYCTLNPRYVDPPAPPAKPWRRKPAAR